MVQRRAPCQHRLEPIRTCSGWSPIPLRQATENLMQRRLGAIFGSTEQRSVGVRLRLNQRIDDCCAIPSEALPDLLARIDQKREGIHARFEALQTTKDNERAASGRPCAERPARGL